MLAYLDALKLSSCARSGHYDAVLVHASCFHAVMFGLDRYLHALGIQCLLDSVADLAGELFLCLKSLAEDINHTRNL